MNFLFKHGEKVAAGVTGAILAGFCAWAYGMPHQEEAAAVSNFESSIQPDSARYRREHADRRGALDAPDTSGSWATLATARPPGPWTSAFRTAVTVRELYVEPRISTLRAWVLPPAKVDRVVADGSGIRIDFTAAPPKLADPIKDNKGNVVQEQLAAELVGWVVERSEGKEGPWSPLKAGTFTLGEEEAAGRKAWRLKDTGVDPKTRYAYRLKPVGRPAGDNVGPVLPPDFGAPIEVTMVETRRWTISSMTTFPDGRVLIGLHVTAYDRSLGREVLGKLTHVAGDRIGVTQVDDREVSAHPAWDPANPTRPVKDASGRQAKVDFTAGARIVKIEVVDLKTETQSCRMEFGADAVKLCKGVETKTEVLNRTQHVLIVDDRQVEQHWWKSTGPWSNDMPARQGFLCPKHAAAK